MALSGLAIFLIVLVGLLVVAGIIILIVYLVNRNNNNNGGGGGCANCSTAACGTPSVASPSPTPICCASNNTIALTDPITGATVNYCTNQPNGTTCAGARMCASNVCSQGPTGYTGLPFCVGTGAPGSVCTSPLSCFSDACGVILPTTTQSVCCQSGTTTIINGTTYCSGLSARTQCINGSVCAGGNCAIPPGGQNMVCIDLIPSGGVCTTNSQCANNTCADIIVNAEGEVEQQCCPNTTTVQSSTGVTFCGNLSEGTLCTVPASCTSGACVPVQGQNAGECAG